MRKLPNLGLSINSIQEIGRKRQSDSGEFKGGAESSRT